MSENLKIVENLAGRIGGSVGGVSGLVFSGPSFGVVSVAAEARFLAAIGTLES